MALSNCCTWHSKKWIFSVALLCIGHGGMQTWLIFWHKQPMTKDRYHSVYCDVYVSLLSLSACGKLLSKLDIFTWWAHFFGSQACQKNIFYLVIVWEDTPVCSITVATISCAHFSEKCLVLLACTLRITCLLSLEIFFRKLQKTKNWSACLLGFQVRLQKAGTDETKNVKKSSVLACRKHLFEEIKRRCYFMVLSANIYYTSLIMC